MSRRRIRDRLSSISELTIIWIDCVLSNIKAGPRLKLPDDETIAKYQQELFRDFSEESFFQPSKHAGFEERQGPKDECIVVTANPPIGETWASIEKRKADVLTEIVRKMPSNQTNPQCIKWPLKSIRKMRQWLISGEWTAELDPGSIMGTDEKEDCTSNTSDASQVASNVASDTASMMDFSAAR